MARPLGRATDSPGSNTNFSSSYRICHSERSEESAALMRETPRSARGDNVLFTILVTWEGIAIVAVWSLRYAIRMASARTCVATMSVHRGVIMTVISTDNAEMSLS
jgi:hypothetical protein